MVPISPPPVHTPSPIIGTTNSGGGGYSLFLTPGAEPPSHQWYYQIRAGAPPERKTLGKRGNHPSLVASEDEVPPEDEESEEVLLSAPQNCWAPRGQESLQYPLKEDAFGGSSWRSSKLVNLLPLALQQPWARCSRANKRPPFRTTAARYFASSLKSSPEDASAISEEPVPLASRVLPVPPRTFTIEISGSNSDAPTYGSWVFCQCCL